MDVLNFCEMTVHQVLANVRTVYESSSFKYSCIWALFMFANSQAGCKQHRLCMRNIKSMQMSNKSMQISNISMQKYANDQYKYANDQYKYANEQYKYANEQ